ncbi:unnamed protein product [Rhizoctonia solani]|uniref:Sister chromatid cohesion protein n=1 Tax=Rhizoctonia solani TaxID=456999 RepID=A0A8H3HUF4_9AGAM|nr:unnamed protein product [Rhizoctonia solani]
MDSSPQVRDAAVDLMGKYLVLSPELVDDYYPQIANRIADTGLVVRKRVIKLLKNLYGLTDNHQRRVDICTKLVLRLFDEDDGIKDLAINTIEELWFSDTNESGLNKRGANREAGIPAIGYMTSKISVIMGVNANFRDRHSPLEDMLHEIISKKSDKDSGSIVQQYVDVCDALTDSLVDAQEIPGFSVVNCIRTVHVFTAAHPTVMSTRKAVVLLPYLKNGSTGDDHAIADYLLKIFRSCIPRMPAGTSKFGTELQQTLEPMVIKPVGLVGVAALPETVACLCAVVHHITHDYQRLVTLLRSCNIQILNKPKPTPQDMPALTILALIVSLLGEHSDFDKIRQEQSTVKDLIDSIDTGPIAEYIYGLIHKLYKRFNDQQLKGRLLQCFGFLFRAHPSLLTREDSAEMMDAIFASPQEEAQARLLKIMQEFLLSEASKHTHAAANSRPKKGAVDMEELIGNTDGFADSGVSSAIIQRYLTQILSSALSPNRHIQAPAADILSFTVRQGLAHPLQCFPIIVALETSHDNSLSSRASSLHTLLHNKHASLLNSRYLESVGRSLEYQKQLHPGTWKGYRLSPNPMALLHRWYSLVREKRQTKLDFLKSSKADKKAGSRVQVLDVLGGPTSMRGLRLAALGLVRALFAAYESQRPWIVEEILGSLIKLPDMKLKAGQFKLRDGATIHVVSALLFQLVQTSAHDVRIYAQKLARKRREAIADSKATSFVEGGKAPLLDEHDREEIHLYLNGLESATKTAKTIVLFLTQRSGKNKNTKSTNEAEYRNIFDNLIQDILVVLNWPEWPAANLLMSIVCKFMLSSLEDVKSSSDTAAKNMALDHLGEIATRLRETHLTMQLPFETIVKPLEEIISTCDLKALDDLILAHSDVYAHLTKRSSDDQAYDSARELTAATWAQELASCLRQCDSILSKTEDDAMDDSTNTDLPKLAVKIKSALRSVWKENTTDMFDLGVDAEVKRVDDLAERFGGTQSLRNAFEPILNAIILALDAPAVFMRTKALRSLGLIITKDPSILKQSNVRRAIESHLMDSSPQVRDAAVDLMGKYLVLSPELVDDYYPQIANRIADTGLVVRKRVIKLLKNLYGLTDNHQRRVDICTKLVLRLFDEDDGIKDLAINTIEELWFSDTNESGLNKRGANREAGIPAIGYMTSKISVIMGVNANFRDRHSPLEDMLHEIISKKSDKDSGSIVQQYVDVCDALTDSLVDAQEIPGFSVVNCIRTVHVFTAAHPTVMSTRKAVVLLPYLKNGSTGDDHAIADYLLKIFRSCIPRMPAGTSNAVKPKLKGKKKGKGGAEEEMEVEDGKEKEDAELTNEDFERLGRVLEVAKEAAIAADCVLTFLSTEKLPKQLYSEDLINSCLGVIKSQLSGIIYPYVETASDVHGHSPPLLLHIAQGSSGFATHHRKLLGEIFLTLNASLPRITALANHGISETMVIQAVFIGIGPFFVVEVTSEKSSKADKKGGSRVQVLDVLGGPTSMRGLRLAALGLVRALFAAYESQRPWIVEEILGSLIKLPDMKLKAGQFKLRDGATIHVVSALLFQLVQTSAHDVRIYAQKLARKRREAIADSKATSFVEGGKAPLLDEHDREEIHLYLNGLESATKTAKTIVLFLTQRSGKNKNTKSTNEAEYRNIFDNLIQDILVVLNWPEWPAANLLMSIVCKFMREGDSPAHPRVPSQLRNAPCEEGLS